MKPFRVHGASEQLSALVADLLRNGTIMVAVHRGMARVGTLSKLTRNAEEIQKIKEEFDDRIRETEDNRVVAVDPELVRIQEALSNKKTLLHSLSRSQAALPGPGSSCSTISTSSSTRRAPIL